jgi:mono/diheme cytochrome c family protein
VLGRRGAAAALLAALVCAAVYGRAAVPGSGEVDATPGESARGEYLFRAGGCEGCHARKGSPVLSGGSALTTEFGTFYGPNLSPAEEAGLGRWTEEDFLSSMRRGRSPAGSHYFPAFPYPSFTGMSDGDLRALWAYLKTVPPSPEPSRPHELKFPFRLRFLIGFWKWLYLDEGPLEPDPALSDELNRGRYLVVAVAHCGECHTPRNFLGGFRKGRQLAGSDLGPEGGSVPNITPDVETGLGTWSVLDLAEFLRTGMTPAGDFAGGAMSEVVDRSTSALTDGDRKAIAAYLKVVPAVRSSGKG